MPTETQQNTLRSQYNSFSVRKNGVGISNDTIRTAVRSRTRTTGQNYSNWKYRIKHGLQATTTLTGTDYSFNPGYFVFRAELIDPPPPLYVGLPSTSYIFKSIFGQTDLEFPGSTPTGNLVSAVSADNRALAAFARKIAEARRLMQGGVFLGELRQTIALVRNPAQSLRRGLDDYVSALKKKRPNVRRTPQPSRLRTASQIVSDTWLEHSFAWTPLISDIKNGAEALARARLSDDRPKTKFISAIGVDSIHQNQGTVRQMSGDGFVVDINRIADTTRAAKYYGKVKITHPSSLSANFGFTPEELIPTVWELIPYSFLVDYFSNIGDIIQAACQLRSSMAWVAKGTKFETKSKTTLRAWHPTDPSKWRITGYGRGAEHWVKTVSRTPFTGSLVPDLEFEIPGFGRKWINMGALLATTRRLQPYHST